MCGEAWLPIKDLAYKMYILYTCCFLFSFFFHVMYIPKHYTGRCMFHTVQVFANDKQELHVHVYILKKTPKLQTETAIIVLCYGCGPCMLCIQFHCSGVYTF